MRGVRDNWGTPPNPRQGGPCTPYWGIRIELGDTPKPPAGRTLHPCSVGVRIDWGTPPNPRQGDPCTPFGWGKDRLGDTPKPPAGRPLHPLLGNKVRIGGHPQT